EALDADAPIPLEGELRVGETVLEDLTVSGDDRLGISAVRDERETVPLEREVPLVRLHRRLDHAPRQREKALVELAGQDPDALDHVEHLVELAERVRPL